MARTKPLTALTAKNAKDGLHADGDGLYLRVSGERRSWVFIFQWQGKRREMGLGPYPLVPLAEARDLAVAARKTARSGVDPIASRKTAKKPGLTFGQVAEDFIKAKEPGWRNAKHRQQWRNSLAEHAKLLTDLPVAGITVANIIACLKPIWITKPETARRVRMRIENVLDAAKVTGLRSGENPARWKGNLAHLLPTQSKLSRGHHAALSYKQGPAFMSKLGERGGVAAQALRFTILTAARTSETRGARWEEFDLDEATWTVPASRMKAGVEHRVPLSASAISILREMEVLGSDYVFPSVNGPLSNAAMSAVLKRMNVPVTVHGFRSTFRDWAGETTNHQRDVVEMALAHKVGNAAEQSYRREDALPKRRVLMDDWESYIIETTNKNV